MALPRHLADLDLEDQIADLRKQLGALRKVVAKRGSDFYEDAGDTISDYLADLSRRLGPSLLGLRRQARTVERVAYDHPAVVATVGLIVIGLVASLFIRRSPARPPRSQPSRRAQSARNARHGAGGRERGRKPAA